MNGINLPDKIEREAAPDGLIILYVGRSTAEKRVHLIAQMAKIIKESGRNIQFQFLGDVKDAIPRELHSYCHFWGNQNDPKTVSDIYRDAHILILVSDTEGFPMVIMEAMAHGLAVIATAVGEIPMHIKNNVNGFLIHNFEDSETVIRQGTEYILKLDSDKALLLQMGRVNADYAFDHFGLHRFNEQYQDLFAEHGYNTG
jgi:glycosyltransferase involved in cell wall biosynthesis